MKHYCKVFCILLVFKAAPSFTQETKKQLRDRLIEVEREIGKIKGYINSGNSNPELTQLLDNYQSEKESLNSKLSKSKKSKRRKRSKRKKSYSRSVKKKASRVSSKSRTYNEVLTELEKSESSLEKLKDLLDNGLNNKEIINAILMLESEIQSLKEEKESLKSSGNVSTPLFDGSGLSGNVHAVSDYIWRGQTQTSGEFAIQGGLDYEHPSGLSIGTWASNVSGGMEVNYYGSFSYEVARNLSLSVGHLFYHFPKSGLSDTSEYNFNISYLNSNISINFTDDYLGSSSNSWYLAASHLINLDSKQGLSLQLAAGITTFNDQISVRSKDYIDYKVSVIKSMNGYDVSVNWTDTDRNSIDSTRQSNVDDQAYFIGVSKSI